MKIIFLEAVQDLGGARKSTIELAKRCKEQGHDVLIVDFWGNCKPFVELAKKNGLNIEFLDRRDSPIIVASKNKIKYFINCFLYLFYMLKLKKHLKKNIVKFKPDIISLNNIKCLSIVPKNGNFKIQFIARGWYNSNSISLFTKFIFKRYKKLMFYTVSQATRQAIYSGGLAKLENIHILTNVIDFDVVNKVQEQRHFLSWDKSIENRHFVIHHCGGFLKTKGQHVSVEVAKKLKKNNVSFKMYMTGIIYKGQNSEEYYDTLIKEIKEYELTEEVKVILNPPNILEYFDKSDVLLFPSYTEGLPRVVLESMAFGKPVIANPVGGVIDLVINNHTGYVTDFNDVDDYYDKLMKLIKDKNEYYRLSQNAVSLIKNTYSPAIQIDNFNKFLKSI